jgi:hypothetical protein
MTIMTILSAATLLVFVFAGVWGNKLIQTRGRD